jgi:phosphodiesterase/alkaline phosphatase D-like protein
MKTLLLKLAIAATLGSLLSPSAAVAQLIPPAAHAEHVQIIQGPSLEMALGDFAIVRWTSNNPGGTEQHFGVVYYGTDPNNLSQMAKNPITLNRAHPETVFRVRMPGLKPQTTYYYKVTSTESNGNSDKVESPVNQFTTPAAGERIVLWPPHPEESIDPALRGNGTSTE